MKINKEVYVIGVYPPPYGGATVKCELFCKMLKNVGIIANKIDIYEANRNKTKIIGILKTCIKAYKSNNPVVYCLDSKRLRIMIFLQKMFKKSFTNTTVLVIGGIFHETVAEHPAFEKCMKRGNGIWVETEGMKENLLKRGFDNVEVFPNPKSQIGNCYPQNAKKNKELKLVYFSQISREKGVEEIIKLVGLLSNKTEISYKLDFYGHIVPEVKDKFDEFINNSLNVSYCGIFDSTKSSVYKKLNEYDILLFPTRWKGEGVPGILVEAKMAGVAVIASPMNFNKEIVCENMNEGFILEKEYPQEMLNIIERCYKDRDLLNRMKIGSYQSRKRYTLEEYEDMIEKL